MIHPGGFLRGSLEEPGIWCPGCNEMHILPWKRGGWTFNGNTERPTFIPSFRIGGIIDPDFRDCSEEDKGKPFVCHFILTDGVLNFCPDSTHALAGKVVPLPKLPEGLDE